MGSKDSMGLPSPEATGVISGSGSFSAMVQRNVSPASEVSPPPVLVTTSSGVQTTAVGSSDTTRPIIAPILTVAATPFHVIPPPYTSDMSTAIVPYSAVASITCGVGVERMNSAKRKRGRPRKYGPDGSTPLAVAPFATTPSSVPHSQKRGRGRPPGSGRKQQLAALGELMAGSAGAGFTPHAITVAAGEDVASKIMSLSQQGPRGICILSANGAISNVTLRQPATSGGTITYEGRFEILSLSGSFLLTESGGTRSRTGGLSVSLAGPDGRVVGGGVAGLLMAASPVQVVVGSFTSNARKSQSKPVKIEGSAAGLSQISASAGTPTTSIPEAQSPANETSDIKPPGPESPLLNQSTGAAASNNAQPPGDQSIAIPVQLMRWSAPQVIPEERQNTDIDISLPPG